MPIFNLFWCWHVLMMWFNSLQCVIVKGKQYHSCRYSKCKHDARKIHTVSISSCKCIRLMKTTLNANWIYYCYSFLYLPPPPSKKKEEKEQQRFPLQLSKSATQRKREKERERERRAPTHLQSIGICARLHVCCIVSSGMSNEAFKYIWHNNTSHYYTLM